VEYTGQLGSNRAVRLDKPFAHSPFTALRTRRSSQHGGQAATELVLSPLPYFEVTIGAPEIDSRLAEADSGYDAPPCVALGLSTSRFPLRGRQPGWDSHSVGLHGDDGCLYHGVGISEMVFSPRFGAGDTVGCGLHLPSGTIFFTLNGHHLGAAYRLADGFSGDLYGTVGIDAHQHIRINTGLDVFQYDPDDSFELSHLRSPLHSGIGAAFFRERSHLEPPPATLYEDEGSEQLDEEDFEEFTEGSDSDEGDDDVQSDDGSHTNDDSDDD